MAAALSAGSAATETLARSITSVDDHDGFVLGYLTMTSKLEVHAQIIKDLNTLHKLSLGIEQSLVGLSAKLPKDPAARNTARELHMAATFARHAIDRMENALRGVTADPLTAARPSTPPRPRGHTPLPAAPSATTAAPPATPPVPFPCVELPPEFVEVSLDPLMATTVESTSENKITI